MDIVALTSNVGCLVYVWKQWDPFAAWLMVPYLGWLGFAAYLNAGFGVLNGWDIGGVRKEEEEEVKEEVVQEEEEEVVQEVQE